MDEEFDYKYVAKCPYCEQVFKTEWSKTMYYDLEEHFLSEHLDDFYNFLMCSKEYSEEIKKFIVSTYIWRLAGKLFIKEIEI